MTISQHPVTHPPPAPNSSIIQPTHAPPPPMEHLLTSGHISAQQQQMPSCFGGELGGAGRLSLAEVFKQQEQRGAELFLRPTKTTDNGQGKPL